MDDRSSIFDFRGHWQRLIRRPQFHEPVVDGIRALAVLWVVIFHIVYFHLGTFTKKVGMVPRNPLAALISRGDLGVDLFFVISGFLMASILFKEHLSTGCIRFSRFYARRFLRLIPVYAVVMALGLYMCRDIPKSAIHMDVSPSGNAENLWANLLYVNNFLTVAEQYMVWCWSLAIEEQFYLLLPAGMALFLGLGKGRLPILVALLAGASVLQFAIWHLGNFVPPFLDTPDTKSWQIRFDVTYDKLHMRCGALLIGVMGAFLVCCRKPAVERFFQRKRLVTALSVVSLAAAVHVSLTAFSAKMFTGMPTWAGQLWFSAHRDVLAAATMFLILAATFAPDLFGGRLHRALGWKGFYPIAQLSYSIYLLHEMVFVWLFPRIGPLLAGHIGAYGAMAADSLIGLAMLFVMAAILYVTVERPCMEMRSLPAIRDLGKRKLKVSSEVVA